MATPGSQWAQIIGSMLGQGNEQMLQKQGMDTARDQRQQQIDLEKQEQTRRAQEADQAFAEHMQQLGARPVVNGVVKRPDTATLGGQTINFDRLDQAGTEGRTVIGHKSAEGDQVQWELPTLHEQILNQWNAQAPVREGETQQAGAVAKAKQYGTVSGQEQARDEERRNNGVQLTPEERQQYGLPDKMPVSTDDVLQHIYRPYMGYQGKVDTAETRAANAKELESMREAARSQLVETQEQYRNTRNQANNATRKAISDARNALTANGQAGLNGRAQLNALNRDEANLVKTSKLADSELERVHGAQALADPNITPDGATFKHPWTGTQQTMNAGWRQQLQGAITRGQQKYNDLHSIEEGIRQRYNSQVGPDKPAVTQPGKPAAPKVQVGQTVTLKSGQKVTIKKINADGTFEY